MLQLCTPASKAQAFSFNPHPPSSPGDSSPPGGRGTTGLTGLVKATASGLCVSGACPDPKTNGSCAPMSFIACDTSDPLQLWHHLDNTTLLGEGGFAYLKNKASGQCLGKWGGPRGTEPIAGTANCSLGWGTGGLPWYFANGVSQSGPVLNGYRGPNTGQPHPVGPPTPGICLSDGHMPTSAVVAYTYSAAAPSSDQSAGAADSVTFLHNTAGSTEHVEFNGVQFSINGSFLIVDQDNRVLFDTSAVDLDLPCIRQYDPIQGGGGASPLKWQAVPEELPQKAGIAAEGWLLSTAPLEQLNTTDDKTDYLLYLVSLPPAPSGSGSHPDAEGAAATAAGATSNLTIGTVESMAFVPFLGGQSQPSVWDATKGGSSRSLTVPLVAPPSPTSLLLVSVNLGNPNFHGYSPDGLQKGIVGPVMWQGKNLADPEGGAGTGVTAWAQLPGLPGEHAGRGAGGGDGWKPADTVVPPGQSLTWYKALFPDPRPAAPSNSSLLFDANGLSRGHFYVNGHDLGRFWTIARYNKPVQRYYYIPTDVLASPGKKNVLVVIDEDGVRKLELSRLVYGTMRKPKADTSEHC